MLFYIWIIYFDKQTWHQKWRSVARMAHQFQEGWVLDHALFFFKSHVEHRPWISWFNLPRIYPGTSIVQSFQDQTPTPPKFSQLYDRTSTKSPLLLGQGKKVQWFSNSLKKLIPVRVTKVDHERLLGQPDMNNNRETSWGNIKMGIETTDLTWSDRSHSFFLGQ